MYKYIVFLSFPYLIYFIFFSLVFHLFHFSAAYLLVCFKNVFKLWFSKWLYLQSSFSKPPQFTPYYVLSHIFNTQPFSSFLIFRSIIRALICFLRISFSLQRWPGRNISPRLAAPKARTEDADGCGMATPLTPLSEFIIIIWEIRLIFVEYGRPKFLDHSWARTT